MDTMKANPAKIKAHGRLTIPKEIRETTHLKEGQIVLIIPVGDSLFITPERLEVDKAERKTGRISPSRG